MAITINLNFDNTEEGTLTSKNGSTPVSFTGQALAPYELYLGGYASCLHSTFKSIMDKKKLSYTDVSYEVEGVKREEVPTIMTKLTTIVRIKGVDKEKHKQVEKSMTLAERYCSISATFKLLNTDTSLELHFE